MTSTVRPLPTDDGAQHRTHHGPVERRLLIGLHGLVAANALYGGIGLMVNGMGMPKEWLKHLPVDSWTLPGVALLTTVMVPQALGAAAQIRDDDRADRFTLVTGLALVAWIAVQLAVLRRYFFLQPVIAAFGVAEAAMSAMRLRRRRSA